MDAKMERLLLEFVERRPGMNYVALANQPPRKLDETNPLHKIGTVILSHRRKQPSPYGPRC